MKVVSSIRSKGKSRDRNNQVVKRHGLIYVINKLNKRMKVRQGSKKRKKA